MLAVVVAIVAVAAMMLSSRPTSSAATRVAPTFTLPTTAGDRTIGRGMHEGLPGHSFVLIDKDGVQRWYGEYPSTWRSPADLLTQINKHLAT